MANVCFGRLQITRTEDADGAPLTTSARAIYVVTERLKALMYDGFELTLDDETVNVDIGFRWAPPFDELQKLSEECRLDIRCLYEEPSACFMGAWRAEDGEVKQDDCIDY